MKKSPITSLSHLSIERPVLAIVMSLVIMAGGLLAFFKLPVREYPDIDPPVVTVTTVYRGASSKVIESEITEPIEEELAGVEGIRTLISTSRDQVSTVVIEFNLERNIDVAAQDVRDKVSRIRSRLPDNSEEPVIAKADADAQPIIWVRVQSDQRSLLDLSEYTDREIKDYFQNINGVSKVIFGGERRRSIKVMLDPKRLAYYGLTVLDIDRALKANNLELPAGSILSSVKEFSVNVEAKLTTLSDYENLIIKSNGTNIVKLRDIADIRVGAENDKSFVRFNAIEGFGLGIIRQAKSNSVEISDQVTKLITELHKKLPKDIQLDIGYDSAQFIRLSIEDLLSTIAFSTVLVIIVIFIFLRNMRSTLIPAVSIPISLIGVMFGLSIMGFSINIMTLLGLVIAIGIIVDDSIIVLENIYRYVEAGMDPKEAAKKGSEEITLAVLATTLVLVAIFLPIAFIGGITGRLLSEFAFALCFSVLISAFVSLTMAPMLCSKLLTKQENKNSNSFYGMLKNLLEKAFVSMETSYQKTLIFTLAHAKKTIILITIACIPLSVWLFTICPQDFLPNEDRGSFMVIFQTQRGSNLELLDKQIRKAETTLAQIPEVKTTISVAAFGRDAPGKITEGVMIARLKDWKDRDKKVDAIMGPLYPVFLNNPDAFVLPVAPKSGPDNGFGRQPIQMVVKTNDMDFLVKASGLIIQKAFGLPSILFAKSSLSLDKPELSVNINREKALSVGVSTEEIAKSLEILFTGVDATEFNDNGENYKVILQVPRIERNEIAKLGEIAVRNKDGLLIPLSNLITVTESVGAEERSHHNQKRSFTIEASPKPGVTAADGLKDIDKLTRQILKEMPNQPNDLEVDYLGTSKELQDANLALYFGFMVALLFAYLFLAGQFESFISPLIIMLTVPFALVGALIGLGVLQLFPFITQLLIKMGAPFFIQFIIPQFKAISFNVYSQIGMIMLIGLASKNGILLVEFMTQLMEEGKTAYEAVIEAARLRLRPILMTAISTVIGALPIALAMGIGSESRQALGVVIVSGMLFSTVLTLFVVPCVYLLVKTDIKRSKNPIK